MFHGDGRRWTGRRRPEAVLKRKNQNRQNAAIPRFNRYNSSPPNGIAPAASEAVILGYGGVSLVSRATGISRPTISNGIAEIKNGTMLSENRVRREGAGRKKLSTRQAKLVAALDALVEPSA